MSQVAAIHARDKRRCWICLRGVAAPDASRDHLTPRSEGGYNRAKNYKLAHRICNSARGRLPVADVVRLQQMGFKSAQLLREAMSAANGAYLRSEASREREAPTPRDPRKRYALAKAQMKENRRNAKARRRAEKAAAETS